MDTNERGREESGGHTARGVLGIVVLGVVLGVGFNFLQLKSGPKHGLAWIKNEVKLVSLESLAAEANAAPAESTSGTSAGSAGADTAQVVTATVTASTTTTGAASRDTSHAARAKKGKTAKTTKAAKTPPAGTTGASAPATSAAASPKPATPAPATGNAWPAGVPAIPDTREPLEAHYGMVKKLYDSGLAVFVDARSADEYAEGHISGATNLPFDDVFKDPDKAKHLETHGRPVVVTYCGGGDCDLSRNLAFSLIEAGHRKVIVFLDGVPGWKEGGAPIATGAAAGTAP